LVPFLADAVMTAKGDFSFMKNVSGIQTPAEWWYGTIENFALMDLGFYHQDSEKAKPSILLMCYSRCLLYQATHFPMFKCQRREPAARERPPLEDPIKHGELNQA
jgi:hypothetical protein